MAELLLAAVLIVAAMLLGALAWMYRLLARERAAQTALLAAHGELSTAAQRTQTQLAQHQAVLDDLPDGMLIVDAQQRVVHANPLVAARAGVPAALLGHGMPLAAVLRAQAEAGEFGLVDVDAEVARRLAYLPTPGHPLRDERVRPDGSMIEVRQTALASGGRVARYADITARRRTDMAQRAAILAAEHAVEQKTASVVAISHAARIPLGVVVHSLARLEVDAAPPGLRHGVAIARRAAATLADLVDDMLPQSQIASGVLVVRREGFALHRLLEECIATFAAVAGDRGVSIALSVDPSLPPAVQGDAGRLRQVLTYLLGEAIQQARAGALAVRVLRANLAGPPMLRIAIAGPGSGADLAHDEVAGPVGSAMPQPAVGAQWAIAQRLVGLMGGRMGVPKTPADGAIWVLLALEAASGAEPVSRAQPAEVAPRLRRRLVLLVEDIAVNQVVTATLLRRERHHVDIAGSGAEALRMLQTTPYDIVLMDLMMPAMDGFEAARLIRKLPGPAGRVTIHALTAHTGQADRQRCLQAGMQGMLTKPVSPMVLARTLAHEGARAEPWVPEGPPRGAPADVVAGPGEPGQGGAQAAILDEGRLADIRRDLPPAVFTSLATQCLADMQLRIGQLRHALTTGETPAIEHEAHALAGMASSYGLAAMERLMRAVMRASRTGGVPAASAQAGDLEGAFARSEAALVAWFAAQPG